MQKFIVFLIMATVFAVSCGGSKKTENNDTDLLPDGDVTDADENNEEEAEPSDVDKTTTDEDGEKTDEETGDSSTGPSFVNICTGLTKCYDSEKEIDCPKDGKDFYGQDTNYAKLGKCVPRMFFVNKSIGNEPVVIDKVTGLEWSQSFFEIGNFTEASDYCENLNYGGHDDWRAPTVKELFSIVDWSRYDPAIDTDYFPKTPSANFIALSADDRYMWIINFSKGATRTTSDFNDKIYLRCVRGNDSFWDVRVRSDYGGPETYYIDYDDSHSKEHNKKSEIFMGGYTSYASTWEEALKYCNEQTFAGISNWRLPNINELMFFLFHIGGGSSFWSSTTYAEDPSGSWIFKYGSGISAESKNSSHDDIIVWCVADAPCEKGLAWTGTECVNFCDPNPCKKMEHSNGKCELIFNPELEEDSYICGCNKEKGALWDDWQKICVSPCDPNPCEGKENTTGECIVKEWHDNMGGVNYFSCVCKTRSYYWNGWKCTNECEGDPCQYEEHAIADTCSLADTPTAYECDCEEGYHWAYFDCEQDYEEN